MGRLGKICCTGLVGLAHDTNVTKTNHAHDCLAKPVYLSVHIAIPYSSISTQLLPNGRSPIGCALCRPCTRTPGLSPASVNYASRYGATSCEPPDDCRLRQLPETSELSTPLNQRVGLYVDRPKEQQAQYCGQCRSRPKYFFLLRLLLFLAYSFD